MTKPTTSGAARDAGRFTTAADLLCPDGGTVSYAGNTCPRCGKARSLHTQTADAGQNGVTMAFCQRTKIIGGGTSYEVRFLKKDKPSHPLHGFTYATTICDNGREFFAVRDAIDARPRWSMPQGWDKYEAGKLLEKKAERLAVRIAKRAFAELRGSRKLPLLWAPWTLESAEIQVPVNLTLPA